MCHLQGAGRVGLLVATVVVATALISLRSSYARTEQTPDVGRTPVSTHRGGVVTLTGAAPPASILEERPTGR
jgi:hypothetical protein